MTGAPPRAGCTFWQAERTSNEEYGCEQAATPLQADQGCGAARARGATSLGHDHGPGGLYCKFELLMRQRNHASWCPAIHFQDSRSLPLLKLSIRGFTMTGLRAESCPLPVHTVLLVFLDTEKSLLYCIFGAWTCEAYTGGRHTPL